MKLLLDENPSRRIVLFIQNSYPRLFGSRWAINRKRRSSKPLLDNQQAIEQALIINNKACIEIV